MVKNDVIIFSHLNFVWSIDTNKCVAIITGVTAKLYQPWASVCRTFKDLHWAKINDIKLNKYKNYLVNILVDQA